MVMSNMKPRGTGGKPHVTKLRKDVNSGKAPSGSEYPLGSFGGGKVTDRGRLVKAIDWKNR